MLSSALPILQLKLLSILQEAYKTQYEPNKLEGASKYDMEMKAALEKKALQFAQKAAQPTAQAICDFVREIGINISIPPSVIAPPLPPSIPGGPCTGMVPMTNITIL